MKMSHWRRGISRDPTVTPVIIDVSKFKGHNLLVQPLLESDQPVGIFVFVALLV